MHRDIRKLRNLGIIAHIDAGKTTVTERMLYYAGNSHMMGNVDDGTTVTDWMTQERERGITIVSAAVTIEWNGYTINLIDTPGHVDFTAEVERSLRVLDGAVGVFCGVAGVQAQSETVWRQADKYGVPRLAFVNKLDRVGGDFAKTVQSLRERLNANAVPIQIPVGVEQAFRGCIDLVRMEQITYSPESEARGAGPKDSVDEQPFTLGPVESQYQEAAAAARAELVEMLADADDTFAEQFLAETFTHDDIRQALRRQTIACRLTPVLCGAALAKIGVQPLLDAACDYLPSPQDIPPHQGRHPETLETIARKPSDQDPFSAIAFKTVADKYGDLTYLRVYSGTAKSNARVYNASKDRREKFNRLYRMRADERIALTETIAGDIVAVVGLKFSTTGDTLCAQEHPIVFEKAVFPDTVVSLAIEPKTNDDKQRLAHALGRLANEDPTFHSTFDEETGQRVISGMGELHLEVLLWRMAHEFGVQANVGEPRVSYRESIRRSGKFEGRFIQQTGGHGQYAVVKLEVEPFINDEPDHVVIENKIRGGAIPTNFISSVEAGIRGAARSGVKYSYPMINARVRIVDGKHHEVDSSDLAFEHAGSIAFRGACQAAGVILLEPFMSLEVTTPSEYQGSIMSDLNKRRALIKGFGARGSLAVIEALAPLGEMFGYASDVRTLSSGRADYSMEPAEFREIPKGHYAKFEV